MRRLSGRSTWEFEGVSHWFLVNSSRIQRTTLTMKLKDRVAIITGGGRGIGRATALRFAAEGAAVVIAELDVAAGEKTCKDIEEAGGKALFVQTNVASMKDAERMAAAAIEVYGKIDILVNNAGITRDKSLKKMTEEEFDLVISVNLKGVFNCTKSVAPHMTEAGYGRILNAASIVGVYGNFGQTNYAAAKAAVIGMTKTWMRELGRKGITVNAVAPGFIETDLIKTIPQEIIDGMVNNTPMQRAGKPEDIANAYLFLASEEAGFITGIVLHVDGGLAY